MKSKHIMILAVVFIGLAVILSCKKFLMRPEIETIEYRSLEPSFDVNNIYSLQIEKGGNEEALTIERKDDGWIIPSKWNARVKKRKVENFLKDMEMLEGELRSTADDILSDYQISNSEAYSFSFYDKKGELKERLLAGTKRPEYGKSFIRKEGSSEVYLVNKDVFSMLGIYGDPENGHIDMQSWMDLSIIDVDSEKVDSIKIERLSEGKKIITVDVKREFDEEKKLKRWTSGLKEAGSTLEADKIKHFLRRLGTIFAKKIVDPAGKDYGLDEPYLTISLSEEHNDLEILVGGLADEKGNDRYVRTPEGHVFILAGQRVKDLDIDMNRFFVDKPEPEAEKGEGAGEEGQKNEEKKE